MLIYLLRHGLTNYNVEKRYQGMWGESELTELGFARAKEAGEHLSPVPFDRIYVSGAMRAAQTASCVFPTRTEEFIYREDLREVHTGELTNQLLADRTRDDYRLCDGAIYLMPYWIGRYYGLIGE